jgi:hypothetical protein
MNEQRAMEALAIKLQVKHVHDRRCLFTEFIMAFRSADSKKYGSLTMWRRKPGQYRIQDLLTRYLLFSYLAHTCRKLSISFCDTHQQQVC